MLIEIVTVAALLTAVLNIRAEYQGPPLHRYIFKPLTTCLIILIALAGRGEVAAGYRWLIIGGLFFSLAGDIFLMLPTDQFIGGLVSFLIAHLLYIAAFVSDAGWAALPCALPLLLYGAAFYAFLAPHLGRLRIPVVLYMAAILIMAWQAAGRWSDLQSTPSALAFGGALLFVISDSVLALNKFRRPFKAARLLNMSTYWLAQWLIALSLADF